MVIDKEIVKKRFGRSRMTYNQHAVIQKRICKEMIRCLRETSSGSFKTVLEIGCGSGLLTEEIIKTMPPEYYYVNDIVPGMEKDVKPVFKKYDFASWQFLEGDAEKIALPGEPDLIISTSTVHWFNNLPDFFAKVHDTLPPGGFFAFSTFGPENFKELRSALNRGLDYPSKDDVLAMLPEDLPSAYASDYIHVLGFDDPMGVLKHIKFTGVNGLGSQPWNRKSLHDFKEKYAQYSSSAKVDGVVLTYHPILIIAKKK